MNLAKKLQWGLRSDDSDEYQTPSEGMTLTSISTTRVNSKLIPVQIQSMYPCNFKVVTRAISKLLPV